MENNNTNQVLSLLKLFNVVTAIGEILVEKEICTKEEYDAKIEEVSIKSGNSKIIERLEILKNVYDIIAQETCTEADREYVLEKGPGVYSDKDLQEILTVIANKMVKEEE